MMYRRSEVVDTLSIRQDSVQTIDSNNIARIGKEVESLLKPLYST